MKYLFKILVIVLVLSFGAVFLTKDAANAQGNYRSTNEAELNRAHSVEGIYVLEVPADGYLPPKLWYTKGDYSGYVYKESYYLSKKKTWVGTYKGTLYLYNVPNKLEPNEEEK